MRLSIIALASFITCAVFASPILSGRGSDGLSLSRRGPGKTTTKTTPKTSTKQPSTKQPTTKQPTTKQSTTKQPTTKQPTTTTKQPTTKKPTDKKTNGAPPKSCPMKKKIKKRTNQAVVDAVNAALAKTSSGSRGSGRGKGKAFPITFEGKDAVIKVVSTANEADVEKEVKNLVGVQQYIAWAVKETGDKKQYFIIMKNMGKTQEEWIKEDSKNKAAEFVALRQSTVDRYKSELKASNPDANVQTGNNFVFHKDGDKFVGEIIDWEIGTVAGEHALPPVEKIEDATAEEGCGSEETKK